MNIIGPLEIIISGLVLASTPDGDVMDDSTALPTGETAPAEQTFVLKYIQAFNDHDLEAMRSMWAETIEWVEVTGPDSKVVLAGAPALYDAMQSYFVSLPGVHSQVSDIIVAGKLTAFVETASWTVGGSPFNQSALAIYQVENGKILRFWYLSAGCTPATSISSDLRIAVPCR